MPSRLHTLLSEKRDLYLLMARRYLEKAANKRWYNYPLGESPRASREHYLELARYARNQTYPEIDAFEATTGFSIDLDWLHDLALHTQVTCKSSLVCYVHGRVLYSALARYLSKSSRIPFPPKINILETGTARGFSALCMAKALHDFSRAGLILTFDVLPHQPPMYWNCIDDLSGIKTRAELLRPWRELVENYVIFQQGDTRFSLSQVKCQRIHFSFLDGAHTYNDVLSEFFQVKDSQIKGDIVIFDDYTKDQYPGIVKAVDHICAHYDYNPTVISANGNRRYVIAEKS